MSDKKVCEVCGRERGIQFWNGRGDKEWCGAGGGLTGWEPDAECWQIGYERKAAILTPEVLRLIKAVREVTPFEWELQAAIRQVRALPLEKPAEPNHTEKQQLPKKGGE